MSLAFYLFFPLELILLAILASRVQRFVTHSLLRLLRNRALVMGLFSVLFLPGIIVHELAHFFLATVMFIPVGEVDLLPRIVDDEIILGSVGIAHTDPFRRAVVGLAPTIIGLAGILRLLFYLSSNSAMLPLWQTGLLLYLLFVISNTLFPSKKDLDGTIELTVALVIVAVLLVGTLHFVGINLSYQPPAYLFSPGVLEIVKKSDLLLSVPILINLLILSPGFLLRKL